MKDNNHENDQHDPSNNEEPKKPSREEGNLDSFLEHIHSLQGKFTSPPLLKVQPVSTWLEEAKQRPIPRKLFSEFWLEGELCMLFADTNLGKSILAVQLAQSISSGEAINGFALEATPQRVLYVDFELSDKQLEARYSAEFKDHYEFSGDFLRAELEAAVALGEEEGRFEQQLYQSLEEALARHQVQVLIIDNITYLRSETERARHALPLMKQLKRWQRKYGLSILTLAHTPKRDLSSPLTRNDLQGSKMLINFCDSAFTIGESQQSSRVRYLKQIKARSTEVKYHSEYVCVCAVKKDWNYLCFEWLGQGAEAEHLRREQEASASSRLEEIASMKERGMSNVAIAKELGIAESTVRHWLKK